VRADAATAPAKMAPQLTADFADSAEETEAAAEGMAAVSGFAISVSLAHEQHDQDDDRDRYAEEEQQ